jgi:hypothetical protein
MRLLLLKSCSPFYLMGSITVVGGPPALPRIRDYLMGMNSGGIDCAFDAAALASAPDEETAMMSVVARIGCVAMMLSAVPVGGLRAEYMDDSSFRVCTNATGYYDVGATNDWLQRLRTSDPQAMGEVAGKWYAEFSNQQLGMVYNNTITYLPTGAIDFTTRTCSSISCSDDYGHGLFTAHRDPNGWIFITRNLTSLTRINQCGGYYLRMDNGVMTGPDGTRWQRLN